MRYGATVAVAVAVAAAGVLIVEIPAIRLMAPLVGMTIETWSAVIAAVLAGLSLGHWWGGRLAEPAGAQWRLCPEPD